MEHYNKMKFKCSLCDYSSNVKKSVDRHINKKIKCGEGEASIIELSVDIYCEFCKKSITTVPNLEKHLKVCKVRKENIEKELLIKNEKIKQLEKNLTESEALNKKPTMINTNNISHQTIAHQYIAQQNIINVHLTAYNNPNLKDIEKHLSSSVKKIFMALPALVEKIHFNEDIPENHNLVIKNARTKIAKVFNGKKWTTMDEEQLLDELVSTYENLLDEYAALHNPNYITTMNTIKIRDSEEKVYDDMKIELKKVLYDNRNMIKIKN
jgi:hypothetical protein